MATEPEPTRISSGSTMFVHVAISTVDEDTGEPVDLSGNQVFLAFMPRGEKPGVDDWHEAAWNADATRARLLIGPRNDGVVYPPLSGGYVPWWSVPDLPEQPEEIAPGLLVIY